MNKNLIYITLIILLIFPNYSQTKENIMILKLKDGDVKIKLFPEDAPKHVERIKKLANEGKYNDVFNISSNKSIYAYEIEKFSENILENNFKVKYPGMNFDETFLNTKIIDEWLNK